MEHAPKINFKLIITIVEKDMADDVIDAAKNGGAEGATVLYGRGSGIHEKARFFGITIEPEKELVLILVSDDICKPVMRSIAKGIDIDKPGNGVCFAIDVSKVIGINHLHIFSDEE